MSVNIILFDLDGTLTDSFEGIAKCAQYALKEVAGIQVEDLQELRCFIGPPIKDSFIRFYGLDEKTALKAVEKYRERYTPIGIYENSVFDGVLPMLKELKAAGFSLNIASSKPEKMIGIVLKHFGLQEYFDHVVGSTMDGSFGTKTEVIQRVIELTGGKKDACVMVGDRMYDALGAQENGIPFIGVTYSGSREELMEYPHLMLADTPEEISRYLKKQR
jgi:phosphoglycolate phosphatase